MCQLLKLGSQCDLVPFSKETTKSPFDLLLAHEQKMNNISENVGTSIPSTRCIGDVAIEGRGKCLMCRNAQKTI